MKYHNCKMPHNLQGVVDLAPGRKTLVQFTRHLEDATPNGEYSPSGRCNPSKCFHPPTACQRRSIAAALGEFPPCPAPSS